MAQEHENREHLGDGVYVHFTGYSFEISVNDHRNPPVASFEPDAVDRLKAFRDKHLPK